MKVTDVPVQTGFDDADIETPAVGVEFTSIVMLLDVAGFPEIQVSLDVKTQSTTSLFAGV